IILFLPILFADVTIYNSIANPLKILNLKENHLATSVKTFLNPDKPMCKHLTTSFVIISLSCIFSASAQETTDIWFVFKPVKYEKASSIDMSNWLDKPAGKHGFLQIKGKDFEFENGTPIKFWGVNIGSNRPFPD